MHTNNINHQLAIILLYQETIYKSIILQLNDMET